MSYCCKRTASPIRLIALAMLAVPCVTSAGTITFTGDSALVAALGGTVSTGVTQIAVGQTVTLPFNATVQGVESVSGSILLTATATGASVRLEDVVFTVLAPTNVERAFGISVTQAFAYSGPPALRAVQTLDGFSRITEPGPQVLPGNSGTTAFMTIESWIRPDSGSSRSGFLPANYGNFSFSDDTFPLVQDITASPRLMTGLVRTTTNPVTLTYDYSTSISTFNADTGAGSSTTLRSGSFGFEGVDSVPEPTTLAMMTVGLAAVASWRFFSGR